MVDKTKLFWNTPTSLDYSVFYPINYYVKTDGKSLNLFNHFRTLTTGNWLKDEFTLDGNWQTTSLPFVTAANVPNTAGCIRIKDF